jgi:hypothetical protein
MTLKMELKTCLLEKLQEEVEINLPYAAEFNRHYLATLQRCLKTIQALIYLESLTQEDIDAASISNGTLLVNVPFLVANQMPKLRTRRHC